MFSLLSHERIICQLGTVAEDSPLDSPPSLRMGNLLTPRRGNQTGRAGAKRMHPLHPVCDHFLVVANSPQTERRPRGGGGGIERANSPQ